MHGTLTVRMRWVAMLGAVLSLCVSLCFARSVYDARAAQAEKRVKQLLKRIEASGAPVKPSQLARPPVPDSENAALVYDQAFAARQLTAEDSGRLHELVSSRSNFADPAVLAQAKEILIKNTKALELIHRAAAMQRYDFHLDWSTWPYNMPQFGKLRECSRLLRLESRVLLQEGRVDDAVAVCAANFRVARAAAEPCLIGPLVQYAIIGMACSSLSNVLQDSLPSASACRSAASDIAGIDLGGSYLAALQGERVCAISEFDLVRASPDPLKALNETAGEPGEPRVRTPRSPSAVRWWLASDELTYLQLMDRIIKQRALPYRKVVHIHPSLEERLKALPRTPPRPLTGLLIPLFGETAQRARDRAIANLGLAEVALLLKAYRAEHGVYPEYLTQLAGPRSYPLPTDPFSGKPFVYRRKGAGFLVYSWGLNLKDDSGNPPSPKRPFEGDMVLECRR